MPCELKCFFQLEQLQSHSMPFLDLLRFLEAPCTHVDHVGAMRKRSRYLFLAAAVALWGAKDAFLHGKATQTARLIPLRSVPEEISEGSEPMAIETFRNAPRNADSRWRTAAVLNISRNETITCAAAREFMRLGCGAMRCHVSYIAFKGCPVNI